MLLKTPRAPWRFTVLSAAALQLLVGTATAAESAPEPEQFNVVVSQRLWFADWQQQLLNVRVVTAPTATTPAVANIDYVRTSSAKTIPVTSLGFRYGRFLGAVSSFTSTTFGTNGDTASGQSTRSELDLSVGYQLVPGLSVSYIRKSGKTSATSTASTSALFGGDGQLKAAANLLGVSANAPLSERLSLYGNLAGGPGRLTYNLTPSNVLKTDARYVVGEFGLVFRAGTDLFDGKLGALTLQLGYRTQSIHVPTTDYSSLAAYGFTVVDNQRPGRTTTEGAVVGVGLVF
ncbi:MAG: hypothetical protein ACK5QH_19000 [Rubrivivax sp.]|jgi:hypothetical protein